MLRNYLKTALRFLYKNKSYSLINILGLSVGMSCFILLTLFVEKEFSYDEYHRENGLIYQVYLKDTSSTRGEFIASTMAPMGPLLEEAVPQINETIRFGNLSNRVMKLSDGKKYKVDRIHMADKAVFDVFSIPLLAGSEANALSSINNIVISRTEALRLFGSVEDAVSEVMDIVDFGPLTISGVFEDLPDHTHLNFDYLISFENADKVMASIFRMTNAKSVFNWGTVSAFPLYARLPLGEVNVPELEKKVQEALNPHRPNDLVRLLPIEEVYFSELNKNYFGRKGEKENAQIYLIIAFVILGVAIINYMNMATARHSKRAKEVGVRKTVGGHRSQIARQFFLESILMAGVSLLLAICLSELALPTLNAFIGKELYIAYDAPLTYLWLLLFTVFIGAISGIYPSIYLSRFMPIQVLTGRVTRGKGGVVFRKVLVSFQFFVCLALIAVTTIVYSQFNYMQDLDMGMEKDQIIGIPLRDTNLKENYQVFKDEVLRNPAINSVSGVSFSVFNGSTVFFADVEGLEESQPVTYMSVEPGFLKTLGIDVVRGKGYEDLDETASKKAVLVNESAVERFGWDEPIGKKLFGSPVTGVVNDFIYGSAKKAIEPLFIGTETKSFDHVYVKLNEGGLRQGLDHVQSVFEGLSVNYPFDFKFLDDQFAAKYEKERRLSDVFSVFSVLAVFVAGLGILGLSMFIAEQRFKEIGIRKVLGANVGQIIWLLNTNITRIMLAVALFAIPLTYYFMSEWLNTFAFHITLDFILLAAPLLVLMAVIWSILIFQSYRSAKANPVNALRSE